MRHDLESSNLNFNLFNQESVSNPGDAFTSFTDLGGAIFDTLIVQNGTDQVITLEFILADESTPVEMSFVAESNIAIPFNHAGVIRVKAATASTGELIVTSV